MNLQLQEHLTRHCQLWQPGLSEWRKEGRKEQIHTWQCADRPQMMADGVKGGIVKKIAVQSAALTIWCQPLAGETWQAGRWAAAVCVTDWEIRTDMQRFPQTQTPGSEASDCSRGRGDTRSHSGTRERARLCMCTHSGCKVTSPIANYRHSASIQSWGSKLHGSTTTRAMCPAVICQTNYLSWACNCSENRYSGNCVVSCNVKWCFPSIFRQDERSKDCSTEIHGSIWPPSQTQSLKIYAMDGSQFLRGRELHLDVKIIYMGNGSLH